MNILITGGTGFLGAEILKILPKKDKIFILDLKKKILSKKFTFIKGNILRGDLNKILKSNNINIIIHLAAALGVKKTENNPKEVLDVNIKGTFNVLSSIKDSKVKKIIFASSSEIYGDKHTKRVREDFLPFPKSLYANSKIVGEELIKSYSKLYNIKFNILRFFNVCGKGQKEDFVITKFAKRIKEGKKILVYGNGSQIRSFCHVSDAAWAIKKVIYGKKDNEIFNIGNNSEPIKIIELAKKMVKKSGKKIEIKKISFNKSDRSAKREIYFRIPDISKAKKSLKFRPKINLNKIINEVLS
jgi:UDP-glucose 4-epimerase